MIWPEGTPVVAVAETHFPKDPGKKVLLYVGLTFFGCLDVKNWRLFQSDGRYWVGYPNSPLAKGQEKPYRQVVPRTTDLQEEILKVMVSAYEAKCLAANGAEQDRADAQRRAYGGY